MKHRQFIYALSPVFFAYEDIEEYNAGFRNIALLDDEDKQHIQSEIDYIIKRKGDRNDISFEEIILWSWRDRLGRHTCRY